jgi:outer membrane receptor protein involved in Fe transport
MVPCLTGAVTCTPAQLSAVNLGNLYGATAAYAGALGVGDVPGAFQALSLVPPAPGFGEQRQLTGSPTKVDWQETTGRFGVDWRIFEDSLVYAFFTRGYKPGGFNPPLNASFVQSSGVGYSFEPEKVDAYEIGTKNTFLDGGLVVNSSVFWYDYSDLQVSRIRENTSINGNMDATIWGVELETFYIPSFLPNLTIDVAYSYLNTNIDNSTATDPLDRTGGNPNYISLENIDPGSLTGVNYVADRTQITPALVQQAFAECGALASAADGNGNVTCTPVGSTPRPVVPVADGTIYPNGIPAYFSQAWLIANGVATSSGFDTDLDGNSLPNSPENTIHIGAAYAVATSIGTFTPRVDYYWQDDSYGREFNTVGDEIEAWDQWNASLLYQTNDGRWEARAWIRNIQDEDNITGHYLTSDTSGFYRNYFLTEPRIYGMSVKFNFGALN